MKKIPEVGMTISWVVEDRYEGKVDDNTGQRVRGEVTAVGNKTVRAKKLFLSSIPLTVVEISKAKVDFVPNFQPEKGEVSE